MRMVLELNRTRFNRLRPNRQATNRSNKLGKNIQVLKGLLVSQLFLGTP